MVLAVNATDLDEGRNAALKFHLEALDSPQSFADVVSIDVHSGLITALTTFDFESRQIYSFLLTVTDSGLVSHSRVATVVLNVIDDNDEVPTFIRSSYTFHVPENRSPGSTVGRIRATDADLSAQHRTVFYSLEGHDSRAFRVSAQTGELYSRVSLDRETQPTWRFRARASNDALFNARSVPNDALFNARSPLNHALFNARSVPNDALFSARSVPNDVLFNARSPLNHALFNARSALNVVDVTVYVTDINDNFPVVRRPQRANETFVIRELLPAGHVVTRVEATDADEGENARLTYTIINGGSRDGRRRGGRPLFVIDDVNGEIVTSRDIEHDDVGRYTLLIAVSDSGARRRLTTTQIIITVNVTTLYLGAQLTPTATLIDDDTDYTVALIVGLCCAAVLLKLVVVGVLCVRHNVALRVHATSAAGTTHNASVTDQQQNDVNHKTAKSSMWKRLQADHRGDVIPSSCSVCLLRLSICSSERRRF